jgi:transcriptional repressor NrdR
MLSVVTMTLLSRRAAEHVLIQDVARGIRISCAKRPVSAADIERMIGQVESSLQKLSKSEVTSRIVGELVMKVLKEVDQVAYIRYAIVYLGLDDLHSIRDEINQLLES